MLKPDGILYINAPQNGPYHKCPGDNWRFYTDAAQALAAWSCLPFYSRDGADNVFPVVVTEQFFAGREGDMWMDCNMIFKRVHTCPPGPIPVTLDRDATFWGPVCNRVAATGVEVHTQYQL